MATMTLLEMVQDILNDLDSDSVNSIDDTVESEQVAQIVKTTYFRLINGKDYPFLKTLTTLTALGDTTNPTKMRIPTGMNKIYWIRYNREPVTYLPPEEFKAMIDAREELADVVNSSGYIINRDPLYWTTYDDDYIYFDSIDLDDESSLQAANSSVYGLSEPSWTHDDSFTPTLPAKMFPTLLADAKGTAFLVLKQQANAKEEAEARRGKVRMQREAWRTDNAEPNSTYQYSYGRK